MTAPDGGMLRLIAGSVLILGTAITAVVWFGRRVRAQLGLGAKKPAPTLDGLDAIPPALVKQALERGLVTSAQLATMTPIERRFVLEAVRKQIEVDAGDGGATPEQRITKAPDLPPSQPFPASSSPTVTPPAPPMTEASAPGNAPIIPDRPRLKLWCPLCGDPLKLPAFPPMVATCGACGARTAIRDDSGAGRYVINVGVAPGTESPRVQ